MTKTIQAINSNTMSKYAIDTPWSIIGLKVVPDHRGNLIAIDAEKDLPFPIRRVYYLYDIPSGAARGAHAHRQLRQLVIAISGSFQVRLEHAGKKEAFFMGQPNQGLVIGPMTWREMDHFSGGAVCMVLASLPYDEADYIRDYEEFLRMGATTIS